MLLIFMIKYIRVVGKHSINQDLYLICERGTQRGKNDLEYYTNICEK